MGADDFIPKPYRMPEVIIARCERMGSYFSGVMTAEEFETLIEKEINK